jgi:outer membrane protein assembly factor BamB
MDNQSDPNKRPALLPCNVSLCIIFLIISAFLFIQSFPAAAANWLHFGYDNQYSAFNPFEHALNPSNISTAQRKWGIGCDDGGFSVISRSPAIYGDTLFTSGAGNRLSAYNARTGNLLWRFGNGNAGWAPQPVASEDGVVFYLEEDTSGSGMTYQLYAVNGSTGQQIWQAPISFDLGFNDTTLVTVDEANNIVYLVVHPYYYNGQLFALNKLTGAILWYTQAGANGFFVNGSYVLLSGQKIIARAIPQGSSDNYIVGIDNSTHQISTTFTRPSVPGYSIQIFRDHTICNNKLIVDYSTLGEQNSSVLAIHDIDSPAVVWQKVIPNMSGLNTEPISGTIACDPVKNVIYVPTNPYLYALDLTTGNEIWKYQGYGEIYNPSVANGVVYFLSGTNMYAIDESTGVNLFSYPLGYEAYETTQVAIDNGMLFFSGNGGTCDLFALALPTATLTVTISGNGSVSSSPEGIDCTTGNSGTCSASFSIGTSVTLKASGINGPTLLSHFDQWTGEYDSKNGDSCTVAMNKDKKIGATFITNLPVHIPGGGFYPSLQDAYNTDCTDCTFNSQAVELLALNFTLDREKNIILKGGFDSAYETQVGNTIMEGILTLATGSLTLENLIIK